MSEIINLKQQGVGNFIRKIDPNFSNDNENRSLDLRHGPDSSEGYKMLLNRIVPKGIHLNDKKFIIVEIIEYLSTTGIKFKSMVSIAIKEYDDYSCTLELYEILSEEQESD